MVSRKIIEELSLKTPTKIVFLVIDGLGGLPKEPGGRTELETARTPNFDKLAPNSMLGLADIVGPGITPGSGAGHLALFGYDPLQFKIGRGILAAYGIGMEVDPNDICIRGNFCTLDGTGMITDRRAGRLATKKCEELCKNLQEAVPKIEDIELLFKPVRDHRFVLRLRGRSLQERVTDTDPQLEGHKPLPAISENALSEKTARVVNLLVPKVESVLRGQEPANGILLRGFARRPVIPTFPTQYALRAAAVATYPMYRGLGRLLGMEVLETATEEDLDGLGKQVQNNWDLFDFFFVHVKKADSYGEDGKFNEKVKVIEEVDRKLVPKILEQMPSVFLVSGDHSSPAVMKSHSWHPVPFMLYSKWNRRSAQPAKEFGETACAGGQLGVFPAVQAMSLAMANAQKLQKYGA